MPALLCVIGMSVYVHNLSPIKESKSKTKYFNMVFQSNDKTYRGVGFDTKFYSQVDAACKAKSPIKITKYRTAPNRFDSRKEDILLNSSSVVVPTDVDFDHSLPMSTEVPSIQSLEHIKTLSDKKRVSCILYLTVKDQPTITTSSLYHSNPVHKKEVLGNDVDHEISVTIWDDNITTIMEDGVYELLGAVFRVYNNGGNVIHVNKYTRVRKDVSHDKDLHRPLVKNPDRVQNKFYFPVKSVFVERYLICCVCKKHFLVKKISDQASLSYQCPLCNMRSRKCDYDQFFTVKLVFNDQEIMVYRNQVKLYFESHNMALPA